MTPQFADFWKHYPRKTAKSMALKAWIKLNPSKELFDEMIFALDRQKQSRQWTEGEGRFIPHASTWLNQERWTDDLAPITTIDPGAKNGF